MRHIQKNIVAVIVMVTALTSCVVGKKYKRAELEIPEQFRNVEATTGDTVIVPWKSFFKDPVLNDLIEKALVKNNEIQTATITIEQLNLAYRQAKLSILPSLNFAVAGSRNYLSKKSLNGSISEQFLGTPYMDDYSTSIALSWEADIWGKTAMRKAGAQADLLAQEQNKLAIQTRIITQVAQAYYNLISFDQQLEIAKRNVALSDSTLNIMNLQFKSGQINSLAIDQITAQKNTAELLLPLTHQSIELQENALSILCGEFPDRIARSANALEMEPQEPFSLGIPTHLLSRRPDVKAAELSVMTANARAGLAKAAMYPAFSITAQTGVNSFKASTWFNLPGSIFNNLAVNLAQPIFQKRELRTAYETALLDQQKMELQFKQTVLDAVGDVSNALTRSKHADERLAVVESRTASLQKANKDAIMLYKSGMATYIEVITAQSNALQNDVEAISIRLDKLNAVTDLYRAIGGGVQ